MYPAPEVCLDLDTWREFCGFDLTGEAAWFGFSVEDGTVSLTERTDAPLHAPGPAVPVEVLRDPAKIGRKKAVPCVPGDFAGNGRAGEVLPVPFSSWDRPVSLAEGIPALKKAED